MEHMINYIPHYCVSTYLPSFFTILVGLQCFYLIYKPLEHEVQLLSFLFLYNLLNQVRRTRISERMRKLQELVPNMDKVVIKFNRILFC